jgi:hypothetical protein
MSRKKVLIVHTGHGGGVSRVTLHSDMSQEPIIVSSHSLFISSSFCLEMSVKIENPASCEIWSVIIFLNAKNVRPVEIYRHVCEVYGENAMGDGMVRRWCRMFSEGKMNVHNDDWSGRPSLVTADLFDEVNEKIRENRRFAFFST